MSDSNGSRLATFASLSGAGEAAVSTGFEAGRLATADLAADFAAGFAAGVAATCFFAAVADAAPDGDPAALACGFPAAEVAVFGDWAATVAGALVAGFADVFAADFA